MAARGHLCLILLVATLLVAGCGDESPGSPHPLPSPGESRGEVGMDEAHFWDLVDSAHREAGLDVARKVAALKARLAALSLDELREFGEIWDRTMNRAYDWKLWAAAYVIHGGCSDDSFSDFRATVISLGRATFEAALRDPDTLLEVARAAGGELCEEDLNYVPSDVWGARTGGESRPSSVPHQEEPHGEDWGIDDLPRIVPKLWKAFGS